MSINVQFAVTFENESKHYKEILDKDVCPRDLIAMFKKHFGKEHMAVDDFALIVHVKDEPPAYLKESNIQFLPRIYMIDLCPQVEKEVREIQIQLASKDQDIIKKALECLGKRLLVQEFVRWCIEHMLHIDIFKLVEKVIGNEELSVLTMKAFSELIMYTNRKEEFEENDDRPFISWLNIKLETIRSTLEYCKNSQNFNGIDSSLKVLVRYVNQNEPIKDLIFKNLDSTFIYNLFEKLQKSTMILRPLKCSIQISLICLINCSLASSRDCKEKYIEKFQEYFGKDRIRGLKDTIDIISRKLKEFPSALPPPGCSEPTKEENDLIQELTKLQYYIFMPIYWDMTEEFHEGPKFQDLELFKQIFSGSDSETDVQIFEKLGFRNPASPSRDFMEPQGHIVFNCVRHLIHHYYDEIINLFAKRGCNTFPLLKIAFSLIKIMDRAIQLTEVVEENMEGGFYMPIIFYSCDINNELSKGFFYELFSKCFLVYAQSLIDLKYKPEDLEEHEEHFLIQINEVMNCYPTGFHEFSLWLARVRTENTRKKRLEAQMEWETNQHTQNPVMNQLRNELESEYKTLVNEKRIRQLQERPYSFDLRLIKSVQRYSLQLDDSQSIIIAKEESDPNLKINKWPISNIKKIVTDKLCSHYQKKDNTYYFSITMDPRDDARDENPSQFKIYNFSCNHKKNYSIWIDGLNILLNKSATSLEYKDDVLNLVRLEMKIRFLLLSKENIHHEAPVLPTLPNNYDFID